MSLLLFVCLSSCTHLLSLPMNYAFHSLLMILCAGFSHSFCLSVSSRSWDSNSLTQAHKNTLENAFTCVCRSVKKSVVTTARSTTVWYSQTHTNTHSRDLHTHSTTRRSVKKNCGVNCKKLSSLEGLKTCSSLAADLNAGHR